MRHLLFGQRHRLGSWAAGLAAGATFGVLMTADAQIVVDPDLPASMLEGSGMNLVEALRTREEALAAQEAEIREREQALLEQRALLVDELEELRASRDAAADSSEDGDPEAEASTGDAPEPTVEPVEPVEPTQADQTAAAVAAVEAEARAMQLDTLARRVQAMSPASAASMLTAMDPSLATEVLETISARNSGKIMDQLSPDVAARLGSMMIRDTTEATP
jgi:flagellar motility protein MotE (MotC chaperone)